MSGVSLAAVPERFVLRVHMDGDWHVGTGYGRAGDVDRVVRRDPDDLPYVPAKTLTGIWRDGCELAAAALDQDQGDASWQAWVDALFGTEHSQAEDGEQARRTPRPAALSVRAAFLPEEVRAHLRARPSLRAEATFVKPGVKLHPASGAAEEDHLRFDEMTRGGVTLEAACRLSLHDDGTAREAATALLVAGAHLVRRLGAKRRRGAGRCRLDLDGLPSSEDIAAWLETAPAPPAPPPPDVHVTVHLPAGGAAAPEAADEWVRVPVRLTTLTPVIVIDEVLGNVMTSRDHIPGRFLLPLVTRAGGDLVASLVAARRLVVTDATVEVDGRRGAPLPLALQHPKGAPTRLYNLLAEPAPGGTTLKTPEGRWCSPGAGGAPLQQVVVARQRWTHNAVEDRVQRPTEAVGGVYTNEAMPPGLRLRAEVRLPRSAAEALPDGWWRGLAGERSFGRSRKDDYGLCRVEVEGPPEPLPTLARATAPGVLRVWGLSDVVLLDERLRPAPTVEALGQALGERLGVDLRPQRRDGVPLAAQRVRRTDAWQASWGRPRPSVVGLRAGSCAVFEVDGDLDPERVAGVEASGVGERCAEGCGQVLLDPPLLDASLRGSHGLEPVSVPRSDREPAPATSSTLPPPGAEAERWLAVLEEEAWRAAIRKRVLELASTPTERKRVLGIDSGGQGTPQPSQLGGLRGTVSRLRSRDDADRAVQWVEHLRANNKRAGKWPDGALEDRVLPLLRDEGRVWELLSLDERDLTLAARPDDRRGRLRRELWAEAVRVLVSALLHAHQRDVERGGGESDGRGSGRRARTGTAGGG